MDHEQQTQAYSGPDRSLGLIPHDTPTAQKDPDCDQDYEELLRSFDMIFQLQQRSEDIRTRLDEIDRILLGCRTVAGLTRRVIEELERELELVAARILLRQDHPAASSLVWERPAGVGLLPESLLQRESLFQRDPFVLDDPSGPLAQLLFGEEGTLICSAAVAPLGTTTEDLGVLCLGSDDPSRYCGGMNTRIIATLADKISLGILNARDHERRTEDAIVTRVTGVFTTIFFRHFLHCEFARAWRYRTPFTVAAVGWEIRSTDGAVLDDDMAALITENLRAADVPAMGDDARMWILLPETDATGATALVRRLMKVVAEKFLGDGCVHAGITQFSRGATVASRLIDEARRGLEEAQLYETDRIVVKSIPPPTSSAPKATNPRIA